jgi:hypothetical protein
MVRVTRTASLLASLRTVGSAVAWLSGSLAGIGAIFYAFGYLITLANLDLLGVDLLIFRYDPTTYIHRGSDFLLLSVIIVAKAWGSAFVVAVLGFLVSQMPRVREAKLWTKQPFYHIGEHQDLWVVTQFEIGRGGSRPVLTILYAWRKASGRIPVRREWVPCQG